MENAPKPEDNFGEKYEEFNLSPEDLGTILDLEIENHGLITCLRKLTDPAISNEEAYDVVKEFNSWNMTKKEGAYDSIVMGSKDRKITVKHYKNGSVSLGFGTRE